MSSFISPGDRVRFTEPPAGIRDIEYRVSKVRECLIKKDSVCTLIAFGGKLVIAALESELTSLTTNKGEN